MQAQLSMLIKHHQSMLKYHADPSSPTTALSDSTHKPCDRCGPEQSAENTSWLHLLRMVTADLEILLRKHHQLMMEYAVRPSSM